MTLQDKLVPSSIMIARLFISLTRAQTLKHECTVYVSHRTLTHNLPVEPKTKKKEFQIKPLKTEST